MKLRFFLLTSMLFLSSLIPGDARATSYMPPEPGAVGDQIEQATDVFVLKIIGKDVHEVMDGFAIVTDYTCVVQRSLENTVSLGEEIVVRIPGGIIGGKGFIAGDTIHPSVGHEYMMFLHKCEQNSWYSKSPLRSLVEVDGTEFLPIVSGFGGFSHRFDLDDRWRTLEARIERHEPEWQSQTADAVFRGTLLSTDSTAVWSNVTTGRVEVRVDSVYVQETGALLVPGEAVVVDFGKKFRTFPTTPRGTRPKLWLGEHGVYFVAWNVDRETWILGETYAAYWRVKGGMATASFQASRRCGSMRSESLPVHSLLEIVTRSKVTADR